MNADENNASATLRAIAMLEMIVGADHPVSLTEAMSKVNLPKPTAYRILTLLERAGLLVREPDGKRFTVGPRLAKFGTEILMNSSVRAPRRVILQRLVDDIGETCNFTMLDGSEVVYLDRVETAWPLRMNLQPGSRVPLHCTASGKLFLAMMPRVRCAKLLDNLVLQAYTEKTITGRNALELELERIRGDQISTDNEEYLAGLICVAVPIQPTGSETLASVALHAPTARMSMNQALAQVAALRAAAEALAQTYWKEDLSVRPKEHRSTARKSATRRGST
jgi:DNA-binding IclR family transcriptional regulator